jgi:arylsulfatase A-like enzyme
MSRPNVVFVFADQWRYQAAGFTGDPSVKTPNIDRLAGESVNFTTAVMGCPVCSPARASMITGQYPLTHGVILNDVYPSSDAVFIADAYREAGYDTAYIGKWHLDGRGDRRIFIPKDRRRGFEFWRGFECNHTYNDSYYFSEDGEPIQWEGYDATAQTTCAIDYIRGRDGEKPFLLFLSWGPPHAPYDTAPERFRDMYDPNDIALRPNVPEEKADRARQDLAGYYAHISALDNEVGRLMQTLEECGLVDDTIFILTSDHGDLLGSQGLQKKQWPYDESIMVPFLLRYPKEFGREKRVIDTPFDTPDIMPTLMGLCDLGIPDTVEGEDFSGYLRGGDEPDVEGALIMCPWPFGQAPRRIGGREYRGVRTGRYTYTRDLDGPWLLYDNENDPYQTENLCGREEHAGLQEEMEGILRRLLEKTNDEFKPGQYYIDKWGWKTDPKRGDAAVYQW